MRTTTLLLLAASVVGCSLDLDRFRGADAGSDRDASIDAASDHDAEVDADASIDVDASIESDAAVPPDATADGAAGDAGPSCAAACTPAARFGDARDVALRDAPLDLAVGEVTGDGRPDIVVLTADSSVAVIRTPEGAPCAGHDLAVAFEVAGPSGGAGLALGDVDGDGRDDLAIVSTTGRVEVRRATLGGFDAPATLDLTGGGTPLDVAFSGGRFYVALGGASGGIQGLAWSSGSLSVGPLVATPSLSVIEAVRLPGGMPGLASSSLVAGQVLVDQIDAGGGLTRVATITVTSGDRLAVGDLDGDGDEDIALNALGTSRVTLVLAGPGSWVVQPRADAAGIVRSIAAGRLDDDLRHDLLAVVDALVLPYLLGDPSTPGGALVPQPAVALDGQGDAVAVADVDGDGLPDVVAAGAAGSSAGAGHEVRVAFGTCP